MKVTNINGTSDNTCKCGSWLKHWEKFSGHTAALCAVQKCSGTNLVGAHVQKADSKDRSWYIVPMCLECNNKRGETIEIVEGFAPLVSANVSQTCGQASASRLL